MNLNPSDWITIVFSLVAVLIGAGVSWIFFRTQQAVDFKNLRDAVIDVKVSQGSIADNLKTQMERQGDLGLRDMIIGINGFQREIADKLKSQDEVARRTIETLGRVTEQLETAKQLEKNGEISTIRLTVERIDGKLTQAVSSILADIQEQQDLLSKKIQEKFEAQAVEARDVVTALFKKEIHEFLPEPRQQDALLNKLVDAFMHGMATMGEYQRSNIEQQSSAVVTSMQSHITESIDKVLQEVVDLKETVDRLPALLAPASLPRPQLSGGDSDRAA